MQMGYAMEAVSVSISFFPTAEHVALTDVSKHVHARVQFDASKGFLELVEDVCLIKRDSADILKEGIDLMGNVTLAPFRYITGVAEVLTDQPKRLSLARKCIALAVMHGAPVDTARHNVTALKTAVHYDDKELVSLLVDKGANPNQGAIPLYFFAVSFPVAHALAPQVNYESCGPHGETVVHHVMKAEYPAKLAQLYCSKCPAYITTVNKAGLTPLKQLMLEVLNKDYPIESACNKMKSILLALPSEQRHDHGSDALVFGQFRSRHDLPGKEHRQELKNLLERMAQGTL